MTRHGGGGCWTCRSRMIKGAALPFLEDMRVVDTGGSEPGHDDARRPRQFRARSARVQRLSVQRRACSNNPGNTLPGPSSLRPKGSHGTSNREPRPALRPTCSPPGAHRPQSRDPAPCQPGIARAPPDRQRRLRRRALAQHEAQAAEAHATDPKAAGGIREAVGRGCPAAAGSTGLYGRDGHGGAHGSLDSRRDPCRPYRRSSPAGVGARSPVRDRGPRVYLTFPGAWPSQSGQALTTTQDPRKGAQHEA